MISSFIIEAAKLSEIADFEKLNYKQKTHNVMSKINEMFSLNSLLSSSIISSDVNKLDTIVPICVDCLIKSIDVYKTHREFINRNFTFSEADIKIFYDGDYINARGKEISKDIVYLERLIVMNSLDIISSTSTIMSIIQDSTTGEHSVYLKSDSKPSLSLLKYNLYQYSSYILMMAKYQAIIEGLDHKIIESKMSEVFAERIMKII